MIDQVARAPAVILLAHGSQRTRATELGMLEARRRLAARLPATDIRLAFFEFLRPTLLEAARDLASQGCQRAVVLPYFLFAGKEIKYDIPAEIEAVAIAEPRIQLNQARELGVDDRLIEHVAGIARGALRGQSQYLPIAGRLASTRDRGRLGVVLCNRGSRKQFDPGERLLDLCARVGAHLRDEYEGVLVKPAQAENSELTVETAARALVANGARRVVVVPYLHFPGKVLFHDIGPAVRRAQAEHPIAKFYLAWTLCANDAAIDVAVDRLREAGVAPLARNVGGD